MFMPEVKWVQGVTILRNCLAGLLPSSLTASLPLLSLFVRHCGRPPG
jgi:hypothetical protein